MRNDYCKALLNDEKTAFDSAFEFQTFLHTLHEKNPDLYIDLFLRKIALEKETILKFLSKDEVVKDFLDTGLLVNIGDTQIRSGVMVHRNILDVEGKDKNPVKEWFIATDWPDIPPDDAEIGINMVFPIHYESIYLLNSLSGISRSPKGKTVLDIFCGSGIFGIFSILTGAKEVVCSDINDRALAFSKFNAHINNIKNQITFIKSNIFENLSSEKKYDLILANPPFEPCPEEIEGEFFYHSYGGRLGLDYIKQCLQNASSYLSKNGILCLILFACGSRNNKNVLIDQIKDKYANKYSNIYHNIIDSVPLSKFKCHYKKQLQEKIQSFLQSLKLEENGPLDTLSLVLMECLKESDPTNSKEEETKAPPPYDWTVPFRWFMPCGISVSREKRARLLLVDPPLHKYFDENVLIRDQDKSLDIPINLISNGTYLRRNFPDNVEVVILHFDYQFFIGKKTVTSEEDILDLLRKWIEKFNPHIIGFGLHTIQADLVKKMLESTTKINKNVIKIAGGPHVTFQYKEFFEEGLLDFAVRWEGEYALEGIIRGFLLYDSDFSSFFDAISNKEYPLPINTVTRLTDDRSHRIRTRGVDIPPMDLNLLGAGSPESFLESANIILTTKRGCGFNCKFCISSSFYGKETVIRPIEYIIREIDTFLNFGVKDVEILDEVFDPEPENIHFQLCLLLAEKKYDKMSFCVQTRVDTFEKSVNKNSYSSIKLDLQKLALLKAARVSTIILGIESASPRVLRLMNKKPEYGNKNIEDSESKIQSYLNRTETLLKILKSWDFNVGSFWILYFPGSSKNDDMRTIDKIQQFYNEQLFDWYETNVFVPYPGTVYFNQYLKDKGRSLSSQIPYSQWYRFGKDDYHAVFETEHYSRQDLKETLSYRNTMLGNFSSPDRIPRSQNSIRLDLVNLMKDFLLDLSRSYEQSIVEISQQSESRKGKRANADYEISVPKIFSQLREIDSNKRSAISIILMTLNQVNDIIRQYAKCQLNRLLIFPYRIVSEETLKFEKYEDSESKAYGIGYPIPIVGENFSNDTCKYEDLKSDFLVDSSHQSSLKFFLSWHYTVFDTDPYVQQGFTTSEKILKSFEEVKDQFIKIEKAMSNIERETIVVRYGVCIEFSKLVQIDFEDFSERLSRRGILHFIDVALKSLFSTLSSILYLRLQMDRSIKMLRDRQFHILHDMKNVVGNVDTILTYTKYLGDDEWGVVGQRYLNPTPNIIDDLECFKNFIGFLRTGKYEGQFKKKMTSNLFKVAENQKKLNRIVWANVMCYQGMAELPYRGKLSELFWEDFIENLCNSMRYSWFLKKLDSEINMEIISSTSKIAISEILGDKLMNVPRGSLFNIIITEMFNNAIKYSKDNGEIVIELGWENQSNNLLKFCITNDEDTNKKSNSSTGIGKTRIIEALSANLNLSHERIKREYFYSNPEAKNKYITWIRFDFSLYNDTIKEQQNQ